MRYNPLMPAGRPSDYRPEYAEQAEKLCRLGATDIQLADFFEVNESTIHRWAQSFPEFCKSRKVGKDESDSQVERSLYRKATGYEFESEKIFCVEGQVIRAKTREFVPPSDTAMIFWLKNRKSKEWRDKQEIELTTDPLAELLSEFRSQYQAMPKTEVLDDESK